MKAQIKNILENSFWLDSLKTNTLYSRTHDDCDGDETEALSVAIDQQGDIFINTPMGKTLRFRTFGGGGLSLRTRNALMILAEAIRLDNENA